MKTVYKFIKALFKLLIADKETRRIAKIRREICSGCKYKNGVKCGDCGCIIVAKTILMNEKCPKDRWQ